jgi:hypothetical protein
MKELKVKLTFIEPILGTSPANPDIYREFIGSHAPDAASVEDEVAALGAFVFLLALRLLKVFDALEATRLLVRTEFLGKGFPPFNENMGSLMPFHSILLHESIANPLAAVNEN